MKITESAYRHNQINYIEQIFAEYLNESPTEMVPSHATHYYVDARVADNDGDDIHSNHKIINFNSNTAGDYDFVDDRRKKKHCSILLCKLYFEHMFFSGLMLGFEPLI